MSIRIPGASGSSFAGVALDNLSGVAINTSLISDTTATDDLGSAAIVWDNAYVNNVVSGVGTALTAVSTIAAATVDSSTAGPAITITAANARAGDTNEGAAAGGSVTVTAGDAARLTSGNANGGDVNLATGSGIGTGTVGVVRIKNGSNTLALQGGGAAVGSATAMPVPTGRVFHVTGTTSITSALATNFAAGAVVTLIFDGILTFTDGNNLKLAGDFVTTADDTITIAYDGSNWFEVCRSVN